jgi:hypothetical protein
MKKKRQNTGLENIAEKKCKSDQFESFDVVQKRDENGLSGWNVLLDSFKEGI